MAERIVVCAQCGAEFTAKRSDARFCGQTCSSRARVGFTQERGCLGCGKDISDRMGNAKFCEPCYRDRENKKARDRLPKVSECVGCGKPFSRPQTQRFCSLQCAGKFNRAKQIGERTKVCVACDTAFTALDDRKKTCSTACHQWAQKHPGVKRPPPEALLADLLEEGVEPQYARYCETCGKVLNTLYRKRFCSKACTPATRPDGRAPTAPLVLRQRTAECEYCGNSFETTNTRQKYCSEWCSDHGYNAKGAERSYEQRFGRTCKRCGEPIPSTERINRQFCSVSFQVCFNQEMRRARKKGLPTEQISRAEIFERDNYICHICGDPVTDRPVIDHLIPLANADCPGHVWENVACAHSRCNTVKLHRVRPEDYQRYEELKELRKAASLQS